MKRFLWLAVFTFFSSAIAAQGFEVTLSQENFRGNIGETIKAPVRLKNTTDRTITLIIKKLSSQIGSTQKNFFCLDNNCQDPKVEDFIIRIEPGQTLSALHIALEGGLVSGESSVKYIAYNKSNPTESIEFDLNFIVEEKAAKANIYTSRNITIQDVYPNPANEHAYVDYKILNDRIKARILIHNILGTLISEYNLPIIENKIKIRTEELSSGIYFYTLSVDDEGVLTRKLVVDK